MNAYYVKCSLPQSCCRPRLCKWDVCAGWVLLFRVSGNVWGNGMRKAEMYVESKTQSGAVTGAGRVGTMKMGQSRVFLKHRVCNKARVLCGVWSYSGIVWLFLQIQSWVRPFPEKCTAQVKLINATRVWTEVSKERETFGQPPPVAPVAPWPQWLSPPGCGGLD